MMGRTRRRKRYGYRRTTSNPWKKDDVVLHIFRSKKTCDECDDTLPSPALAQISKSHLVCAACTGVDEWAFLPAGNTGLTRRASSLADTRCVVVGKRGRGVIREGILIPKKKLKQACEQLDIDYIFVAANRLGHTDVTPEYSLKRVEGTAVRSIKPKPKRTKVRTTGIDPVVRSPQHAFAEATRPGERKSPKIYKPAPFVAGDAPKEKPSVSLKNPHPEPYKTSRVFIAPIPPVVRPARAYKEGHDGLVTRIQVQFPDVKPRKVRKIATWALQRFETTSDQNAGEIISAYLRRAKTTEI